MSTDPKKMPDEIEWLGLEAPRYTSYPSAHHFSPQVSANQHRDWFSAMEAGAEISAYVHIPFCKELCWFCGCHTKMTRRYDPIAAYVRILLQEIETLKRHANGKGQLVNMHFGGGSPSLLEARDLVSIRHAVTSAFQYKPMGEFAIELDPRTTTPENIKSYADAGVNRVSVGIQDFDPVVQQAINRVQPFAMVASVMDQLRHAGLSQINCDLIYGLPRQTPERFRDTLEKTMVLNPQRIALFSYAHMPRMKKHQGMIDSARLPSAMEKLILYAMACETLVASGYVAIGIDHFAKSDDPLAIAMKNRALRRNFQGYVTDASDVLIGIGSSAISQFRGGYAQNNPNMSVYRDKVTSGALPSVRGWKFGGDDLIRKQVIDELMCFMSVDLADIRRRFHLNTGYFQAEMKTLRQAQYRNIIAVNEERIHVATPYRMAARVAASIFDRYRNVAAGRYSKVA